MPVSPSEANRLERTIEATLGANGSLVASVQEKSIGHAAASERREFHDIPRTEYEKLIEAWVNLSVSGARVSNISAIDDPAASQFTLKADVAAPNYAQLMQNRLLVFKPAIVSRRSSVLLTEPQRKHPIMLPSRDFTETVRVKLPAGFEVDELPDPVKLQTEFGTYSAVHSVENGNLVYTRLLSLRGAPGDTQEPRNRRAGPTGRCSGAGPRAAARPPGRGRQ